MTKEEFKAFFESQCIPANLPFDEIAKRWGAINNNLDTILPSKLYRFRKVKILYYLLNSIASEK